MRLGLSTDAAPGASADEIIAACARRGLAAVEVTLAGGSAGSAECAAAITAACRGSDVQPAGLLSTEPLNAADGARLSLDSGAPRIIGGSDELHVRIDRALRVLNHGGNALVLVTGPADQWLAAVDTATVGVAWQVDATCIDPAADAARLLQRRGRLVYVRLVGGGPETAMQEGRGIGALMRQLTLAGYTGPLILAPSSSRYHVAWSAWLGRRGGWGCGSKAPPPLPLQMAAATSNASGGT